MTTQANRHTKPLYLHILIDKKFIACKVTKTIKAEQLTNVGASTYKGVKEFFRAGKANKVTYVNDKKLVAILNCLLELTGYLIFDVLCCNGVHSTLSPYFDAFWRTELTLMSRQFAAHVDSIIDKERAKNSAIRQERIVYFTVRPRTSTYVRMAGDCPIIYVASRALYESKPNE